MKKFVLITAIVLISFSLRADWSSIKTIGQTEDLRGQGYNPQSKIIRDVDGRIFVTYRKVYTDYIGSIYQNYMFYSDDNGSSWSVLGDERGTGPLQAVDRGSDGGNYNQRVGGMEIDNNGVIHFVWYGKDKNNTGDNEREIKYSRFSSGDWSDWINIDDISGYIDFPYWQEHPTIAVGYTGNLYVVWEGRDSDNTNSQTIKFAASLDGGNTWETWANGHKWKNITGAGADNSDNASDLFGHGQARPIIMAIYNSTLNKDILYVLWYGGSSGHPNICLSYSLDLGKNWSKWYAIAGQSNLYYEKYVDAAFDKSGNLHVVWSGGDSTTGETDPDKGDYWHIKYAVGSDTNSNGIIEESEWTHWSNISTPPNDYADEHPNIAIDSNDNVHIVYERTYKYFGRDIIYTSDAQIYYKNKLNGSGWSSDVQLSSSSKNINIYPYLRWSNYYANGGPLEVVWTCGDTKDDDTFDVVYRNNTSFYMNPPGAGAKSASIKSIASVEIGVGETIVYPNPFENNGTSKLNFVINFLKGDVVEKYLYVFDMLGNVIYYEKVDKNYLLNIPFEWDGKDNDGDRVKKGLYFYRIKVKYNTGRTEYSDVGKFFIK